MERRKRSARRAAPSRIAAQNPFPHIAALIEEGGQITIGAMRPIKCAAIANDRHDCLAMLQRKPEETLQRLLERLDAAIERAWDTDEFTDEINGPSRQTPP